MSDAASPLPSRPVRSPRRRRGRSLAATAGALAAALLVTGCSLTSRNLTLEPYAPADGLDLDLGEVAVRNVLVVSEGSQAPGMVSATLVNRGSEDVQVLVEAAGASEVVRLTPGESVQLGSGEEQVPVVLEAVDAPAGGLVDVTFTSDTAGAGTLRAPIYGPQAEYATITPPASAG